MSTKHSELISRFYEAFAKRDAKGMADCYHENIHFSDPVFPDLRGPRASGMWRMLCETAKELTIEHSKVKADETTGSAHWEARYPFSATGRQVYNRIDAEFRFQDGLIIEHKDHFDFWRWSRMALGPAGLVLGWTPILRNKVRGQAGAKLDKFMQRS